MSIYGPVAGRSYPQAVAESGVGGGACSAEVAADGGLLAGGTVEVCHGPGTAGT